MFLLAAAQKHDQERGSTINRARYSEMFIDKLKPEIPSERRGNYRRLLFSCMAMAVLVLLLAIKTSRHSSLRCLLTLCIVPMSPLWTIYNLFGPLKETLRGCRFTSGQQPRDAGHAGQTKPFFCWKKCLKTSGRC